jgi:hypothetical protein
LRINCPYRYRCVGGELKVGESAIVKPMKEKKDWGNFHPTKGTCGQISEVNISPKTRFGGECQEIAS